MVGELEVNLVDVPYPPVGSVSVESSVTDYVSEPGYLLRWVFLRVGLLFADLLFTHAESLV